MLFFRRKTEEQNDRAVSAECILACIYFICLPFTVVTTPLGSLLKVITMPITAVLLVRMLMGKSEISFNYVHFTYVFYLIYTVSLLFVYSESRAVITTKDMLLGALMFMLISMKIYNEREKRLMESAWLIVGIICIYACLSSKEVVSESMSRVVIRILGFEEDQNQFCAYLIMPTLVCIKRFLGKGRLKPFYAALLILSLYSILKTGSRGGLLGILLGIGVYALIGIDSVKARAALVCSGAVVTLFMVTVIVPRLPENVMNRYSVSAVEEDGGSGRTEIWKFLINYSFENPRRLIRGSGIVSTYSILPAAGFQNGVAHNVFIQILNDEGIIGLLLYIITVIACLVRNVKRQPMYACAHIAMLGFYISLTFYVFKPNLNIMMMCAMSFQGCLPEDDLADMFKGGELNA